LAGGLTGLAGRVARKGSRDHQRHWFVMDLAARLAGPDRTVLEAGPGDGTFGRGFLELGYRVVSAGPDPGPYPWPHHRLDLQRLGLPETFDLIHAGQVLEHVPDPDALMANLVRMTRPDSVLVVSVPDFTDPEHLRTYDRDGFHDFARRFMTVDLAAQFRGRGRTCFLVAGHPWRAILEQPK
jgi:SAM-dependent methyltransferase